MPITQKIRPCQSAQEITLTLNGEVRILPKEDAEGYQAMEGSATMIMSATQEGCQTSDYQLQDATTGPVSVPWDVTGKLRWHSAMERPQCFIFVSQALGAGDESSFIYSLHRGRDPFDGTWGEWQEIKIGLEYMRFLSIQSRKGFVPHSMSETSTSADGDGLWIDEKYHVIHQHRWPEGEPPRRFSNHFSLDVQQ